jgi:deazaflavin-dependent oxidoreductase (nitroreductase family)
MVSEMQLAQGFKVLNRLMVLMWRLGLGRMINVWPDGMGRIMVIGHRGRRSGVRRWTPVNYEIVDGDVVCTAGFGKASDWYRNILADPKVELWLPDGRWEATAQDISDDEQRLALMRRVLIASGFAAPLFGVYPRTIDDEKLQEQTASYRLLRFHRSETIEGPGGPGDLAWVWLVIAVLLLIRPRRRARRRPA